MRVTNAPASRKRRKRTIRAAKGFRMRRSKLYRYAADALDHGRQYAYRDRRAKKRTFRALWQVRINAAARSRDDLFSPDRRFESRQGDAGPQNSGRHRCHRPGRLQRAGQGCLSAR